MDSRCCTQYSIFAITDIERGACDAALHLSQHTTIELLPNVHINEKMELSGFHFEAAGCDMANVLPMPTNLFDCNVAYEVISEQNMNFNDRVLHILQNMEEYKQKLNTVIEELKSHTGRVPTFPVWSTTTTTKHATRTSLYSQSTRATEKYGMNNCRVKLDCTMPSRGHTQRIASNTRCLL